MGRIATIPWGGADIDNRERRLIKDATKAAGRYLKFSYEILWDTLMKGISRKVEEIGENIECEIGWV